MFYIVNKFKGKGTLQAESGSKGNGHPDLGPKILFFSGGSALRGVSQRLVRFTYNSVHIMTPFDSGGSSAVLRRAFAMPAIGDIRNRLMALMDPSLPGCSALLKLFAHRLPFDNTPSRLRAELVRLVQGTHALLAGLPPTLQSIVLRHLDIVYQSMPRGFDLAGASIGNLVLTGAYLENAHSLDAVIDLYSKLARVRGTVLPVVQGSYHLGADLADGKRLVGQHLLTGKQAPPIGSPITSIFLTSDLTWQNPCPVQADVRVQSAISEAELICYPMGSFFTSLLSNLLPRGIAESIHRARCAKVFVPSTFPDPECLGLSLQDQVRFLLRYAGHRSGARALNYILVDQSLELYPGPVDMAALQSMGVEVVMDRLVTWESSPAIDPDRLVRALFSLISGSR